MDTCSFDNPTAHVTLKIRSRAQNSHLLALFQCYIQVSFKIITNKCRRKASVYWIPRCKSNKNWRLSLKRCCRCNNFLYRAVRDIPKTCLYNVDPLKPHFYIVKLGFTGVYIIFLVSAQKHRLWVLVRTASARRF